MHPLCPMPVQSIIFNMSAAICCHTNSAWEKSCNRDLKKLAFSVQKSLKSSNVIKLVRKGAHQRESGAQKGQKTCRKFATPFKSGKRCLPTLFAFRYSRSLVAQGLTGFFGGTEHHQTMLEEQRHHLLNVVRVLQSPPLQTKPAFNDSYTQVLSFLGRITLKSNLKIGYNYISQVSLSRFKEIESLLNLLLFMFQKVRLL